MTKKFRVQLAIKDAVQDKTQEIETTYETEEK